MLEGLRVVDIFDEVSEDLRADRARRLFKKYGYLLGVAALLIVAGVSGWQFWQARQARERGAVAAGYMTALRDSSSPGVDAATSDRAKALAEFLNIGQTGPEGYRTLARLSAAALKANGGDVPGALGLWDQVSADEQADPQLRDVANLLWVQHQVDTGDPPAVQGRLAPLIAPGNPWRPLALESQAWLLLRTGETDKARDVLRQLATDATAPPDVRGRAGGLLTQLGDRVPPAATGEGKTSG